MWKSLIMGRDDGEGVRVRWREDDRDWKINIDKEWERESVWKIERERDIDR